jgi:hypothetical protein
MVNNAIDMLENPNNREGGSRRPTQNKLEVHPSYGRKDDDGWSERALELEIESTKLCTTSCVCESCDALITPN